MGDRKIIFSYLFSAYQNTLETPKPCFVTTSVFTSVIDRG